MKSASIILLLFLVTCSVTFAQVIIDKGIYKVNFSNKYRQPLYVSYKLYKGGGDCNRAGFNFKNDESGIESATDADYDEPVYDKGHLANAEDFAYDCTKDELTFRYYNCLPQTASLNRGVWKKNETLVRKWSQTDSLYIICGGYFGNQKIGNIYVPNCCWKVVQSLTTKQVMYCGWFSNTAKATVEEITVSELEKRLKSKIILYKKKSPVL